MPKKNTATARSQKPRNVSQKQFHFELLNTAQKMAFAAFQQHDVIFLLGPAGTGKTFLATAFAIKSLLSKECTKIVLNRPIVESGESLGYLPGDFEAKINPYMMPIYDCIDKLASRNTPLQDKIVASSECVPFAYMRGRNFDDAVCICDEAQNATMPQLRLFLSRFTLGSKLIIAGDPAQSDIPGLTALSDCVERLEGVPGIGIVEFKANSIVRHPLIATILDRLGE